MATGIQISPPSGITIGTTAIDSGVDTRVLFQQGGVVQQSAQFTFEEATNAGILRIRELGNIIYDLDARTSAIFNKPIDVSGNSIFRITTGGGGSVTFRDNVTANSNAQIITTSAGVLMDFNGGGVRRVRIDSRASEPTLQVRAAGALSTDIAFRVRNSADSYDMLSIDGAGRIYSRGNNHRFDSADAVNYIELGPRNSGQNPYFRVFRNAVGDFGINLDTDNRTVIMGLTGSGKFAIGTGAFSGTVLPNEASSNILFIKNGTAPALNFADNFQLYSADIVAGNAAPHFRTEAGNIIKLYTEPAVTTTQGIANALTNLGLLSSSTISSSLNPATVGIQAGNATTTNTAGVNISKTITVTGGTLAASCVLDITTRLTRLTGNSSLADVRIYYNTSNSLTGATLIARSEPMQGTDQSVTLQRTLTIAGGNIIYPFANSPLNTDIGINATAFSTSAFNVATTYFILICSSQSGTDQFTCSMAKIAQYA